MDRHNNGRTASPESGLERREQMQKSVKKSNKKTGAAGKYTAPGAFGGAQPSNLVELIEAQRGKAASSAGKKQAADTALANEWANLQLQSFGQFGADTLSPTWGRVEETPEMTAAEARTGGAVV